MKTIFRLIVPLVLAIASVTLHVAGIGESGPTDLFTQGGLAPLAEAEALLASGRSKDALSRFQLAAQRSLRAGQIGAYERIRRRIASAGKQLAVTSFDSGWPYLSLSCVMAREFTASAKTVEAWLLSDTAARPPFEYPLMRESGVETLWGGRPERIPLYLFRWMDPERQLAPLNSWFDPVRMNHQKVGDLPSAGRYATSYRTWLYVIESQPFPPLDVRTRGPSSTRFCASTEGVAEWNGLTGLLPGENRARITVRGKAHLDRIIAVGDGTPSPFQAFVVRDYEVIPGSP